ncbi:MAG: pseudouridine synthase [Lentisphaeraceae bacterium]|nr:pseudouridine synthase [Lentisphaeraceae bacterium]
MALDIIYEDEWLIAINKPVSMLVHPGRDPEPDDQIAMKALRNHLSQYVYILHRLDRPTSGVLLFAKDQETQSKVSIIFQERKIEKRYYALVRGETSQEFSVDLEINRAHDEVPRPSLTHFSKLKEVVIPSLEQTFTLLNCHPITGRIHQIRRHLEHKGHAIMGDYLYGDIEENNAFVEETEIKRMMLMSYLLEFTHPYTDELIRIELPYEEEFGRIF